MYKLTQKPLLSYKVDGKEYVLLQRTINGIAGSLFTIHRMKEDAPGVENLNGFDPTRIMTFDVPEVEDIVKTAPNFLVSKSHIMIHLMITELGRIRADLKIKPYVYLGYGSQAGIGKVLQSAYLDRLYFQGMRPKGAKKPIKNLEGLKDTRSVQAILGCVEQLGIPVEEFMAPLLKSNFRYVVAKSDIRNQARSIQPNIILNSQEIVGQVLTYDHEAGTVLSVYCLRKDVGSDSPFELRIIKTFPAGTGWKVWYELSEEERTRMEENVLDMFKLHLSTPEQRRPEENRSEPLPNAIPVFPYGVAQPRQ